MRRTLPVFLAATLLIAACSSDDTANDETATDQTTESTGTDPEDVSTSEPPVGTDPAPPPTNPDKPTVEIPDEIPTELQVTVLQEGTGPASEAGDTVIVDYVGVRSRDGVEFDNSYDRFEPFAVELGQGRVIAGWDEGLVGAQAGSRIQLDIPSDLAYGDQPQGDIIGENEVLTFVIDVRAVVPPGNEPTEPGVDLSEGADEVSVVDLVEGDGPELEVGQLAFIRFVLFRGDNGVLLQSNWAEQLRPFPVSDELFPPLFEGLQGMQVGDRRAITFPPEYPEFGFGPEGNPTGGLPESTDVIMVVDLVGLYDDPTAD
jgi:peptidylprolyl isomerase